MTYHIRAFEISLVVHVLLIAAIVIAGSLLDKPCPPLVISFDIANAGVKEVNLSAPPNTSPEKQQKIKRDEEKIIQHEPMMTSPISDVPISKPAPQAMGENVVSLSRQETSKNGVTGSSVGDGAGQVHEGGRVAKERYLREHFLYIKNRILDSIIYPNIARRMGWHGNVLTSFVIHVNGTVSDIKILRSSGFKVLDENTVMTIKDVSPFPKPPIMAKIIIPISYSLIRGR